MSDVTNDVRTNIATCCKSLRLRRLTTNLDLVREPDPERFLLGLLELEVSHRTQSRIDRNIKQAGFYTRKTFDDFSFDEVTLPSSLPREDLEALTFIDNRQNLILYGNVGTGKTHLATALGVLACQKGKKVAFYRTASLVTRLVRLNKGGALETFLKSLEKVDLIICDEWGYVPISREGAQLLFQVVSACYETKSIIITTNLEFSKWATIFLDEAMTTAMIDRLIHHGQLLIFDGKSHRVQQSLMRR